MDLSLVYVTFGSEDEARRVARVLLEKRLCACVTFWPAGSMYWWEGAIETAEETLALFKTRRDRVTALREALVEAHGYDVPCVLEVPVDQTHAPYADWIGREASATTKEGA